MSTLAAQIIFLALAGYAGLGVVFAIPFVARGVQKIDAGASGAPVGFRLLIFPGVVAFWPLLLTRWLTARGAPEGAHP